MSTKRINGIQLEKMIRNGLANLEASEEEVNSLNVFPVADGDTGTNMCLTLANGLNTAKSHTEAGAYLKELSEGMLLGARGNSGVILSQLFRGMWVELSRHALIGPGEMRNALIRAYRTAYDAVACPVEGTILTVSREGIEHIRSQITRSTGIDTILSMYIAEMRKTLAMTPQMLDVLKEAGVIDSGSLGYILICEGMLKYLYGEVLQSSDPERYKKTASAGSEEYSSFDEFSAFDDGYCMEFLLQLMKNGPYDQRFNLTSYIEDLKTYGESIVAIRDNMRVKVHVHTKKPAKIISMSQEYGEFINFKLENMQIQHNEHTEQVVLTKSQKALATVAAINGDGMKSIFERLGYCRIIDCNSSMNTSSEEFLEAINSVSSECIAVLPNNPNSLSAAEQAAKLYSGSSRIVILYSRSMVEGYFALALDVADSTDSEYRLSQMRSGIKGVTTLGVTTATRDYAGKDIECTAGERIVMLSDELYAKGSDTVEAVLDSFSKLEDMDEKEICIMFRGANADDDADELTEAIMNRYPMLEVTVEDGGQDVYDWLIGLS